MPNMIEIEAAFRDAATARGLLLPSRLASDGKLHRCGTADKPRQTDGAYILHMDSIPAGGFENHADGGGWQNWCSRAENEMSDLERTEHRTRMVAVKKQRDAELTEKRARAAAEATQVWARSHLCVSHPYLTKKGIKPHGVRVDGAKLVLALMDIEGVIHTLQTIDEAGDKMFLPGGRKQGCFYAIGNLSNPQAIFITEGFATAASAHEATGVATVVAFDCGNLRPVAESLRRRWPRAKITICADDDWKTANNPGLTHAMEAAKAIGGMVAMPKFGQGRTPDQTDWNDVHKAFGIEGVKRGLEPFRRPTFSGSPARVGGEFDERTRDSRHILEFGIQFLDDALGGITRSDLVLIGAKTGAGKSQLSTAIAMANCKKGKRVHYFALEAEDREIERRMKYQVIAGLYYADTSISHKPIRYLDWRMGILEDEVGRFNEEADALLIESCKGLHTYYRVDSFTSDDFAEQFAQIHDKTDLVILDHFHYVDSDDQNEYRGMKRIVKEIRDCALRANRPVIVVGHVRKSDPKFSPLVPSEEAFHGSSDLVKIATKAVMIAPDYERHNDDPTLWSTFIQAVKCRQDSSLTRYVARILFDIKKNEYCKEYELGKLTSNGKQWTELETKRLPAWNRIPRAPLVNTIPIPDDE